MKLRPRHRVLTLWMLAALVVCAFSGTVSAQPRSLQDLFDAANEALKSGSIHQPLNEEEQPAEPPRSPATIRRTPAINSNTSTPQPDGEALPPPAFEGKLPLAGDMAGDVQISHSNNGNITLVVRDASLSRVLALLAQTQQLNIVAAKDIDALISITLRDVPIEEALTAILSVANYTWVKRNNIILITSLTDSVNLPADVQGRQIQVFDLDFASASATADAVSSFLSPIGKVSIQSSDSANNRLTQERIVVEDLPSSLVRIADFICQIDQPPRQVLIEAHILQVTLNDETRCGVNFDALFRVAGARVNILSVPSAAVPLPTPGTPVTPPTAPAMLATISSSDLNAVLEALQTTTDTKTLGSPKILVLNQQTARMNVGKTIGVQSSTQTELQVTQTPISKPVGVILEITPSIAHDGRVLLNVRPEVSDGQFNPLSGAIDTVETTLETDVMLRDGQGIIIGGLIKETDEVSQSKIPYLGDVKGIGWLFRRSQVKKERQEIVFAIIPRIQPYDCQYAAFEQGELVKATVPLFYGPLNRTDRFWDPVLPDGKRAYKPLNPWKYHPRRDPHYHGLRSQYVLPPRPLPEQYFSEEECCDGPAPISSRQPYPVTPHDEELLPEPQMPEWMFGPIEFTD